MRSRRRAGFTLIEIMIVVVILAILAATIIPQFSTSVNDSKVATMQSNLHTLRSQIQLYALQHGGLFPTITSAALPQLTGNTDISGNLGSGGVYIYGPYVQTQIPVNPIDGHNTVTATAVFPPTAATSDGGWLYDAATGQIAPNTTGHLTE